MGQILPPDKNQIEEVQKLVTRYFWGSHIFKVDARQLFLKCEKGGMALVNVELKLKALFVKQILYGSNNTIREKDHFLLSCLHVHKLSRNTSEWAGIAMQYKTMDYLNTVSLIYDSLLAQQDHVPKIQIKFPNYDWVTVWENYSSKYFSSEAKSMLYVILNDIFSNNEKLCKYKVRGQSDNRCVICNKLDTNFHRIKDCKYSGKVWKWVEDLIRNRIHISINSATEIVAAYIGDSRKDMKAALWIVVEAIMYNMKHYKNPSLFVFQNMLRNQRWNQRLFFKKVFGKYVFVF